MMPFSPNRAQLKFLDLFKKKWHSGEIIRILILKARQHGFSTLVEAIIYVLTSQQENQNSLIVADDIKGSQYILEMSKLYQEKCANHIKTPTRRSNEKKLEFDQIHSQIIIDTSDNKEAGRKYTFRLVHLSEYAFFRYPKELMLGLSQSVPALPRTMIVKESTANGFNHFKDEWDDAVDGKTDYLAFFAPWYWSDDYKMPVDSDFILGDPVLGEITKDEYQLTSQMQREGVTEINERLTWRRWCIRNNCDNSLSNFQQEYPSTPEEAFIASGECFFNKEALVSQLNAAMEPLFRANIVRENFKPVLRVCEDGDYMFFENPDRDGKFYGQYDIGGDCCSGEAQGDDPDYSALEVGDKFSNKTVCIFHARVDPDTLAEKAALLGEYFNNAKIGIENDKFGFSANKKLLTLYGNVYMQKIQDKKTKKITRKFGWDTTSKTRPLMLSQLQQEIREASTELSYKKLIRECLTFIRNNETKKVEAQEGCHDDLVIARAIRGIMRLENPYDPVKDKRLFPHGEKKSVPDTMVRKKQGRFRFRKH